MTAFVANTNLLELSGLKNVAAGTFINDATVTVTVKKAGTNVAGASWPLTMDYVAASDGIYRAVLSEDLALVARTHYTAFIDADGGDGRVGHWEFDFRAETRTTE
jgi:hypothetical protein